MNWAANKGGAKSRARTKIIVLGKGKYLITLSFFFVKEGSQKCFPCYSDLEHTLRLLALLYYPKLWHTGRGGYPVVRCEFVGNNKQWSRGQPGYWRAQVGPYGYLTPAFYYNPSSSTTTSVFVFTLLLTYNVSTMQPKQRSRALSFGTGCSFTRATNHLTTLI